MEQTNRAGAQNGPQECSHTSHAPINPLHLTLPVSDLIQRFLVQLNDKSKKLLKLNLMKRHCFS